MALEKELKAAFFLRHFIFIGKDQSNWLPASIPCNSIKTLHLLCTTCWRATDRKGSYHQIMQIMSTAGKSVAFIFQPAQYFQTTNDKYEVGI